MQTFSINPGKLKEVVQVPPSKSYANRALIMAVLVGRPFSVKNLPDATDVANLLACLEAIGLRFKKSEDEVKFLNSFPECEVNREVSLYVGEGGTTARFLATMLLLGQSSYELILGERLKERPWNEFIDVVLKLGGKCELRDNKIFIQGPIRLPQILEIDCARTTQFASAFQLLSVKRPLKVIPINLHSSQSYWAMTEVMVEHFKKSDHYTVPSDLSSASYPLAFGALNHPIFFPGLKADPLQADSKFLDLLTKFNCLSFTLEGMAVVPSQRDLAVELDVSDCLDLVPTLGYFLSHVEGRHVLTGIENLVYKESNRLEEVVKLVRRFEREAEIDGNRLTLWGKRDRLRTRKSLVLPDDHRLVMSGALFLLHHGGGEISPAQAVKKSYPAFFELISSGK